MSDDEHGFYAGKDFSGRKSWMPFHYSEMNSSRHSSPKVTLPRSSLSLSLSHTHANHLSRSISAIGSETAQFLGKANTDLEDLQKFYPRVQTLRTFLNALGEEWTWAGSEPALQVHRGAVTARQESAARAEMQGLVGSQTQVKGAGCLCSRTHRSLLSSGTCTFCSRAATLITHLPCA